tara:strand:+ start:159 stop:287 length:129 start_codon:yes stop_codon:yes gene_type:complete
MELDNMEKQRYLKNAAEQEAIEAEAAANADIENWKQYVNVQG